MRTYSLYRGRVNTENCRANVAQGGRSVGFNQCGRTAKLFVEQDGEKIGLCKQHHDEPLRRAEKQEKADAARQAAEDRKESAQLLCERIGMGTPTYNTLAKFGEGYTGGVTLSASEAAQLAERLGV